MKKDTIASATIPLSEDKLLNHVIPEAHLEADPESQLDTQEKKETPLMDATLPYRDETNSDTKKASLLNLVELLNVEQSLRYQRTPEDTYCNVYTYDFCYFSNVYIPTVWWTPESLEKLKNGETVIPIFEDTVERIYSSAIHDWLGEWGPYFGWQACSSPEEIQNLVNENGGIGIICAKRREVGKSGHILPVIPETEIHKAYRENGVVKYPLQSQAGKINYNYFAIEREAWWEDELYSSYVLYYHP